MSTRPKRPRVPVNAAAAADDSTVPVITPTLTHYRELADRFTSALDDIAAILPELQPPDPQSATFVRTHQSIPLPFVLTATAGVTENRSLQNIGKLDAATAFDSLQFVEAFYPVIHKLAAFKGDLAFTVRSRQALLGRDALDVYYHAKRLAQDPENLHLIALVETLKRELGPRGKPKKAKEEKNEEVKTTQ
jgi:hypothetical protein